MKRSTKSPARRQPATPRPPQNPLIEKQSRYQRFVRYVWDRKKS